MPKLGISMPKMGISTRAPKTRSHRRSSRKTLAKGSASASMTSALFSRTRQRLLGLLFGQPDRRFFANELISLTGSGSGAVRRELQRLTESGLVNATKEGTRRYFQANQAAPLFSRSCEASC
jgi:Fic family protein